MICPRVPRATISRAAAWPTLKHPVTLTSRCVCHCDCETSRKGAASTMPALPIATSSGSTAASASSIPLRSVTSTCRYEHEPAASTAAIRSEASASGTRSSIVTWAPRPASSRAIALPRSPAAPVTATPSPARSMRCGSVVMAVAAGNAFASPAAPQAFALQGRPVCGFGGGLGAQLHGLARPEEPTLLAGPACKDQDRESDDSPDDHDQRAVVERVLRVERMQRLDVLPEDPRQCRCGQDRDQDVQPEL